jgi:hypothetical protein
MVKKISYIVISVAILVTGYFAFSKLNYWERSVRIFKINNSDQPVEGRMGRGPRGFERPAMRELPDSIQSRFESGGERPMMRNRNIPDSLRQPFRRTDGERVERGSFEGGIGRGDGRGRGDFPGGKRINLRNVAWFLGVFAAFAVISIYLDKMYCLIRKRRNSALRTPKL